MWQVYLCNSNMVKSATSIIGTLAVQGQSRNWAVYLFLVAMVAVLEQAHVDCRSSTISSLFKR